MRADDTTALMLAASVGDEEIVKLLLAKSDAVLNAQNIEGFTALHAAAQSGHEAVVLALLAAGAKVDVLDEQVCILVAHCIVYHLT